MCRKSTDLELGTPEMLFLNFSKHNHQGKDFIRESEVWTKHVGLSFSFWICFLESVFLFLFYYSVKEGSVNRPTREWSEESSATNNQPINETPTNTDSPLNLTMTIRFDSIQFNRMEFYKPRSILYIYIYKHACVRELVTHYVELERIIKKKRITKRTGVYIKCYKYLMMMVMMMMMDG